MHQASVPARERGATLRVDRSAPRSAWLQIGNYKLVIDDDDLWGGFADREVIVTGECYLDDEHFRIHTLRVADLPACAPCFFGPYLAVGPEQILDGELVISTASPGSAGTSQVFVAGGARYGIAGPYIVGLDPGRMRLRIRVLTPDPSYVGGRRASVGVARSLDRDLWIVGLDQPRTMPDARPCTDERSDAGRSGSPIHHRRQ